MEKSTSKKCSVDMEKAYGKLKRHAAKMAREIIRYSDLRDEEWDFVSKNGFDHSWWDESTEKEHAMILDMIQSSRNKLSKYVGNVLGMKVSV